MLKVDHASVYFRTRDGRTVHVLVLDEPLNGADPVQRLHLIALFKQLGAQGKTVIVSSHVLNEVERLAERVIVLIHDQLREGANDQLYGGWPMVLSGIKTLLESGEMLTTPGSLRWLEGNKQHLPEVH